METLKVKVMEIYPDVAWVRAHDEKISRMLIQNPWNDPMVKKVGLYDMYVIDALGEALELPVEEDAKKKLGFMNPKYKKMHELVSNYIETPTEEEFIPLLKFCEQYLGRKITLVKWVSPDKDLKCWPDIRVLDTPDECLSWLLRGGGPDVPP
jgi:hypothetical protein